MKGRAFMVRYFKKIKNGMLDGIGRAKTAEYAEMLLNLGYEETTQEYYVNIMNNYDLYINYMIE